MAEDISGEIRLLLEQLVDRFVVKGCKAPDVFESMQPGRAYMFPLLTPSPPARH
ncbi:hypothetical protein [Rhizobium mongolense]|uniref:Uncharacterized protein n=1 Tax=Rhizobium mongolense TaxID=57676 RepID=A0ABR6IN00_9HYPH|nr:hypothetical protein [Rhizobium mongolense]MBB4228889.1 hypothetical protein [Rhizobium mongolense]